MKFLPGFLASLSLGLGGLSFSARAVEASLPEGFELITAAAPPLVHHPITATLGGPGQLFVGDAAGLNLNKAELEKQLPNRILLLTDQDGDGVYDRSTVFADRMTFPQGAVWLDGALYVMSPPGLWKLTDTDGDGVADQREMLVSGFDYTGNAADVHGPFLHPNGRLYWCHGRKAHQARGKDGVLVHEGLASGVWSCRPDGMDLRWHALASGDNPVEIDFTPEGEILGTMNLFYSNPRGDTLVHWLSGGVYPREDQLKAIEGLPRTLDPMPVVHNFGHVAVSGCAFYRSGAFRPEWRGDLFVVHFNTQRVTRISLTPEGASYRVAENEFLRLKNSDMHLTDVLEDRDGSLLVTDTGGWFRIGCPSSLLAKPDITGGIYRVRAKGNAAKVPAWGAETEGVWRLAREGKSADLVKLLSDPNSHLAHAAGNALAFLPSAENAAPLTKALSHPDPGVQLGAAHALGQLSNLDQPTVEALLRRLDGEVDRAVEHQAMAALFQASSPEPLLTAIHQGSPALQRRALVVLDQFPKSPLTANDVLPLLDLPDAELARAAVAVLGRHLSWSIVAAAHFDRWLTQPATAPEKLALLEQIVPPALSEPAMRDLVTQLIGSSDPARQRTAWRILGAASTTPESRWADALAQALGTASPSDLGLVLEAAARLKSPALATPLQQFSADEKRPLTFRLKALRAALKPGTPLSPESFTFLSQVLGDATSPPAARMEAARILASAKHGKDQLLQLTSLLRTVGPVELHELLRPYRGQTDPEITHAFALALKDAASFSSFQESEIRTLFSTLPGDCFALVAPALQQISAEDEARRRKLATLPALIASTGRPEEGRKVFESGRGACMACHRVGEVGNFVGPNLSTIGQIRTERDILESVLFPSATLARGYELQSIETTDGQTLSAVVHRNLPAALVVADATGQERTLPRNQITSMQAQPTSLMPIGLDRTLPEQDLIDLIAYLRSRK